MTAAAVRRTVLTIEFNPDQPGRCRVCGTLLTMDNAPVSRGPGWLILRHTGWCREHQPADERPE